MTLIGAGDVINKVARKVGIPIASYLLIQSSVFFCIIIIITLLSTGINITLNDILYSLIGAIFSFAAFTLMLHSLTHGYASINYAIFRLSFIFSSAAAIIFLNESLRSTKILGIIIAIISILIFFHTPAIQTISKRAVILAAIAMALAACYQFILKLAALHNSSSPSFLLAMSIFFTSMVILYNIVSGKFSMPRKTFIYAPLNGLLMSFGTLALIIALSKGEVSITVPIIQLSFLITVTLSVVFLKENINIYNIIGIICAAVAIIVLGWVY